MKPLFLRFGLPWLIFGTAIYALCWNILYGERAYSPDSKPTLAARSISPSAALGSTSALTKHVSAPSVANNVSAPSLAESRIEISLTSTTEKIAAQPRGEEANSSNRSSTDLKTLSEMDEQGIAMPPEALQQMATTDRDPAVRALALTKYAQDPSIDPAVVKSAAEASLNDADPTVSANAREILEQVDQATRSNDEIAAPSSNDTPVE